MSAEHPRPELAVYADAASMSPPELVVALRDILGAQLLAYLGKVKETSAVRHWAEGSRSVGTSEDVERLRIAYCAARLIAEHDNAAVAQVWFQGLNPVLDDQAPALLLREGELADIGPQILSAAGQFAAKGEQLDPSGSLDAARENQGLRDESSEGRGRQQGWEKR